MSNIKCSMLNMQSLLSTLIPLVFTLKLPYSSSMAFESFRKFLEQLEVAGELTRISQPVASELEITELADRQMKAPSGGKALLFEKPTVNGQLSPFPLAINTLGSA